MMRCKKMTALLAAAAMTAGLCACGSGEDASGSVAVASGTQESSRTETNVTAEAANPGDDVEKPESISWWSHDGLNEADYVKEWDAKYEELTGIKLEHTQVANNEYNELLEVAFASGTEPDVFDLSCDQKVAYYASQGAIADLTDLIKKYGLYDQFDQSVWDAISVDGKIYGIPKGTASGIVTHVRQDWLDELGISAPTNYEEYIEMLRNFRDNIDECTIPLTVPGLAATMNLPEFYQDAEAGFTYKDGKWVDGMLEDNFADAMQRLQDAYAEGLIDTEAVTNTTSACRDKWYSGEVGVFSYWAGKWTVTLEDRLKENFPDASVTVMEAIDETDYRYTAFNVLCIDGRLSEEEVEQVFRYFLNYIFDGGEGQELFFLGVEGLHYSVDANGYKTYNNMASAPDSQFQSVWGSPWALATVRSFDDAEHLPKEPEKSADSNALMAENGVFARTTPSSQTLNTITADLTAIREETIAKIVMGSMSVEDGIASYKKQTEALGIEQVLNEMNQ